MVGGPSSFIIQVNNITICDSYFVYIFMGFRLAAGLFVDNPTFSLQYLIQVFCFNLPFFLRFISCRAYSDLLYHEYIANE